MEPKRESFIREVIDPVSREIRIRITDDTSTDHQKRLDQIAKEEDLLTNIIKQQFDIKLATVNLQSKNLEQLRGATKGQKERLKIEQQLSKNSIEQEKLKLAIFGLEQQALVQGVDMSLQDQRLLDLNRAKLEVIKQQNIDLMRQKDIGAELEDTIKNSFEFLKISSTSFKNSICADLSLISENQFLQTSSMQYFLTGALKMDSQIFRLH